MFFQGRFEGYVEDLVILTHEAGHAVQNMLMDSAGVKQRYASGPSYFTESFAMLSELLLLERLYQTAPAGALKRYYLNRLLEAPLGVFRNAHESLLELQIYDSVAAGRVLDANGVERLTQELGRSFSVWFGPNSEQLYQWVQPLQLYTWPMYRVNYVIAELLALQYLDLLHRDPVRFQNQYGKLLRHGYDAPPEKLLNEFLGLSISNPDNLVTAALRVAEPWIADAMRPE